MTGRTRRALGARRWRDGPASARSARPVVMRRAAAAPASPRPATGSAACAGSSPSSAAAGGGRRWCRSCCSCSSSPARPARPGSCSPARPRPTAARTSSSASPTRGSAATTRRCGAGEPEVRREWPRAEFVASYRIADQQATVRSSDPARSASPPATASTCRCTVRTRDFRGPARHAAATVAEADDEAYVDWSPALRLPGLREARTSGAASSRRPARRPITGGGRRAPRRTSRPLPRSPARRRPPASRAAAWRRLYDERLGGRPGAELHFGHADRPGRQGQARPRAADHDLARGSSSATIAALGDRLGGVAVIRPRTGECSASPGSPSPARSRPARRSRSSRSPPRSRSASQAVDGYPVRTCATLSGVRLRNASDESCGGSLATSFAHSCNSVFAPLGAKLGAKRLVRYAEATASTSGRGCRPTSRARSRARDLRTTSRSARPRSGRSATSPRRRDGLGRRDDRQPRRARAPADRAHRARVGRRAVVARKVAARCAT